MMRASANAAGVTPILGRVFNLIWFLVCWFTLVGLVCAVLGGFYFYGHVDESIRGQVERHLAQQYPDFSVSVAGAKLIEREGFEIRGISFSEQHRREPMLFIDEVLVRCRPTLDDLLKKNPAIQEVIVRHAKLTAQKDQGGEWNFSRLLSLPPASSPIPRMALENGELEIVGRESSILLLRNFYGKVVADPQQANVIDVDIAFTGNRLRQCAARAKVDRSGDSWTCSGSVGDLFVTPELQQSLPEELAAYLQPLSGLESRASLEFAIKRHPQMYPRLQFEVQGKLAEGRWMHSSLPFPITDLTGDFHLTQNHQKLRNVSGRYGDATIQLDGRRDGVAPASPIQVRGSVSKLRVDRNLVSQLPADWQQKWSQFQPLGLIDSEFQFDFAKRTWVPRADIRCRDVSFTWKKHPYPIERAAGEVSVRPGRCVFELRTIGEKQPIRFTGDVSHPGSNWTGWVETFVEKPIPLDERVISAMSPKAQQVVRPFAPQGAITMVARSERTDPRQEPYRRLSIDFHNGSIRHKKFPYPLQNVAAHIERHGNDWQFTNIVGQNDGAIFRCQGGWRGTKTGGDLTLHFTGANLPLEEELRTALSPTAQHLWAQLRPQGSLDNVQATFQLSMPERKQQLVVRARKLPEQQSPKGHSLSVSPISFPYRIDNVNGSVVVANDQIKIEKLRGRHGKVTLTTSGVAKVSREGPWSMTFSPVNVDRLRVDDELATALPPRMRRMLNKVPFTGPISLGGSIQFAGNARSQAATRAEWDLDVDLEDGRLNFEIPIEHISGSMHLNGRTGTNQAHCRGNLNVDSLICRGTQFSNVRGPLWVDQSRILLGKQAQPANPSQPPQRLTAKVFGGNLSADIEMLLKQDSPFQVTANLDNARGAPLTRTVCDAPINGQAWANFHLTGNARGSHTWAGGGTMQLRNTNLYELPFVLSLLKTIRTGSSDRTAFTSSDIAFHLKGKHVYFDQLDLQGDALTLKGVGEMDMQRELNLKFYTMMGREDSYMPAIRPLLGMASRRFMMVHVAGNANNPTMSREVLPDLNDTLRQLFPEADSPAATQPQGRDAHVQLATSVEPAKQPSTAADPADTTPPMIRR